MSLKAQSVILKSFQDLDKEELYKFLQLRIEVFVVEQNCPYQDFDDLDQEAQHMWIEEEGEVICYLRINSPGTKFDEPSLGRIVTKATHRSQGLAAQLIHEGLKVQKNDQIGDWINIKLENGNSGWIKENNYKSL